MTKFEEEFKALTSWEWVNVDLIQQILTRFGNWHSDEEFQTKENELKRIRKLNHLYKKAKDNAERMAANSGEDLNQAQDEISALKKQLVAREKQVMKLKEADKAQGKEIVQLKSQLQQQALPVVKDFVAEWYEEHKDDLDFSIFEACVSLYDDNPSDFKKWFGNSENKSIETLVHMKDGYTVEKPQLFYLKHIDMSKRDSDSDWYLIKDGEGLDHEWEFRGEMPEEDRFKFTQQEIDSMNTGSYEQIEVAES